MTKILLIIERLCLSLKDQSIEFLKKEFNEIK